MGLYRATLNQPELRVGKTGWFQDDDPDVRKRVLHGHLVPVDEVAKAAVVTVTVVEDTRSKQQRILDALAEARAANLTKDEKSSVETAVRQPEPEPPAEPTPVVAAFDPPAASEPKAKNETEEDVPAPPKVGGGIKRKQR
jgi:hypothetical protein